MFGYARVERCSFTDKGVRYCKKVYELPEGTRTSKGRAVQNLLSIESEDKIRTYLNIPLPKNLDAESSRFVTLFTKKGVVKKTDLADYTNSRSFNKGIIAINIREGDELLDALLTDGTSDIMVAARNGRCCRFNEESLRALGRNSSGVKAIDIEDDDEVIGALAYDPKAENASAQTILVVSENGYGKRSDPEDYRLTSRGAKGVKTISITDKTGPLVAIKNVTEENDLMIITKSGLTIREAVTDIRVMSRATQGVKLINIREGDSIAAICPVAKAEEETEESSAETTTQETEKE